MRGPGQVNWDASIFKNFTIKEKLKAQFRTEALNATNTPLFYGPNVSFRKQCVWKDYDSGELQPAASVGFAVFVLSVAIPSLQSGFGVGVEDGGGCKSACPHGYAWRFGGSLIAAVQT